MFNVVPLRAVVHTTTKVGEKPKPGWLRMDRYRFHTSWARFGRVTVANHCYSETKGNQMKITRNALLRGCLLASVPIASMAQAPTIVEAESGSLGTSLTTGTDATAGVNYITVLPAANNGATPTPDR